MTKQIRIENADTSHHRVMVQVWEKGCESADGSIGPDVMVSESPLDYPTSMVALYIHSTRYLVIKEV